MLLTNTNFIDNVDPAFQRAGRIDHCLNIEKPSYADKIIYIIEILPLILNEEITHPEKNNQLKAIFMEELKKIKSNKKDERGIIENENQKKINIYK